MVESVETGQPIDTPPGFVEIHFGQPGSNQLYDTGNVCMVALKEIRRISRYRLPSYYGGNTKVTDPVAPLVTTIVIEGIDNRSIIWLMDDYEDLISRIRAAGGVICR